VEERVEVVTVWIKVVSEDIKVGIEPKDDERTRNIFCRRGRRKEETDIGGRKGGEKDCRLGYTIILISINGLYGGLNSSKVNYIDKNEIMSV